MAAQPAHPTGRRQQRRASSRREGFAAALLRLLLIGGPLLLLGAVGSGYYVGYYRPAELEQTVRGVGVPFGFSQFEVDVGPGDTTYQGRSEYQEIPAGAPTDVYQPVENTARWVSQLGLAFDPQRIDQCYQTACTMSRTIGGHDAQITLSLVATGESTAYAIDLYVEY